MIVSVHEDHDIDHVPPSVIFSLPYVQTDLKFKKKSKLFSKYKWKKADISLYILKLTSFLSLIRAPYNLLQLKYVGSDRFSELKSNYKEIAFCLKEAECRAVPLGRIRIGTQKSIWSADPNVKTLKNKAKFWLRVWNDCDRPRSGCVVDLEKN